MKGSVSESINVPWTGSSSLGGGDWPSLPNFKRRILIPAYRRHTQVTLSDDVPGGTVGRGGFGVQAAPPPRPTFLPCLAANVAGGDATKVATALGKPAPLV